MEALKPLTDMLLKMGTSLEILTSVSAATFVIVAALRLKLPSDWTEGQLSNAIALVVSLVLSFGFVEQGNLIGLAVTAIGAWLLPALAQGAMKGTSLEMKRNGSK